MTVIKDWSVHAFAIYMPLVQSTEESILKKEQTGDILVGPVQRIARRKLAFE